MNSKSGVRSKIVSEFVPLLHGVEKPEFVSSRQALFADAWTAIDARIQVRQTLPERKPVEEQSC